MRRNLFWGLLLVTIGALSIAKRIFSFDIPVSTIIVSFALIFWGVSMLSGHSHHRGHRRQEESDFRDDFNDGRESTNQGNANYSNNNFSESNTYTNTNTGTNRENNTSSNTNSFYDGDHMGSYKRDILFSHSEITANGKERKYDVVFSDGTINLTVLPAPMDRKSIKIDVVFSRGVIKINPDIPAMIKVSSVFSGVSLPNNSTIAFGDYTYVTRSFREGEPHYSIKIDSVFSNTEIFETSRG